MVGVLGFFNFIHTKSQHPNMEALPDNLIFHLMFIKKVK